MKYLFLDVDGVLNNNWTVEKTKCGHNFVDDILVERVATIVKNTGAKVVFASCWRKSCLKSQEDLDCYNELVDKLNSFDIYFYDETAEKCWNRGIEIKNWFASKGMDWHNECFVILDDQPPQEFEDLRNHVIMTNGAHGVTEYDVDAAIAMLNGEKYIYPTFFYERPTQVRFIDLVDICSKECYCCDEHFKPRWLGGIATEGYIICGCCGGKFSIRDFYDDWKELRDCPIVNAVVEPIVDLEWESISKEIADSSY